MAFIQGDSGANVLTGTAGNDTLVGLAGNDTLTGGVGNDSLDGGTNIDTAVFSGNAAQYTFAMKVNAFSWKFEPGYVAQWRVASVDGVAARDGNDTMDGIEFFQFADGTVRWHDVPVTYTVDLQTSDFDTVLLAGGTKNDTMTGHAGSDIFVGGLGDDVFDGKGGDDLVTYNAFNSYITMVPVAGGVTVNLQTGTATGTWGNDSIANIEQVAGTAYADLLIGDSAANVLYGVNGNDTLRGGDGDDSLFGGNGVDWAIYAGPADQYLLNIFEDVSDSETAGKAVTDQSGHGGVDGLWMVERLQFDDIGYAFDLDGNAGAAARLVGVLMGPDLVRNPVVENIVIEALDSGLPIQTLANIAIDFLYPGNTPQQLAQLMYAHVIGGQASPEVVDYLVGVMAATSPAFLAVYASTIPQNDAHIDFAGLAVTGVPFLPII